jgi:hypothetical protein
MVIEVDETWFYCWIPCLHNFGGGKSVYTLDSRISVLDYTVELEVTCRDSDMNDVDFVQATVTIGGRDTVEEFVAYGMHPLASNFVFRDVTIGTLAVSKVETPLLVFPVEPVLAEDVGRFLVKVESDIERILGSFSPNEYDALVMVKLLNNGHLNWVFEQMGIPDAPPTAWYLSFPGGNSKA